MKGSFTLRRLYANLNIKTKFLLVYLFGCVTPCLILGIGTILYSRDLLLQQRSEVLGLKHTQTSIVLTNATNLCVNVSDSLLFDEEMKEFLSITPGQTASASTNMKMQARCENLLKNYPEIEYINIYTDNPQLNLGFLQYASQEIRDTEWFRVAGESKGVIRWYAQTQQTNCRLRLVRKMPLGNGRFAVIVIGLSDSHLRLILSDSNLQTAMFLDGETVVYSSAPDGFLAEIDESLLNEGTQTAPCVLKDNSLLCFSQIRVARCDGRFSVMTVDTRAPAMLRATVLRLLFGLLLLLGAATVLVWAFSSIIARRVVVLRDQMRSIAQGDLSISQVVTGSDELGELFRDMTRTVQTLQDLNVAVYEKELSYQKLLAYQREIEYKVLASQVNPHFLFNTLESIRMKAVVNGQGEIAQIVRKLGLLMRRLLSVSQNFVSLEDELELIHSYMDIQHFRFGNKIVYEISIQKELDAKQKRILPLLILPLVENAVLHGLETMLDTGLVRVDIRSEGSDLCISVQDNGVGMDESTREMLQAQMEGAQAAVDPKHHSIGLYNVNQRIRLCYGEQYGLRIYSEAGKGTRVDVLLPLMEKGEAR